MKVLVVGDPHFKVGNIPESDEMVDRLVKVAKVVKPRFIVVLGDVLHRHEKIHVSPLMRAEKMIRLLSEISHTYLIVGNHDRPNNSNYLTDEHPFNAMKHWNNTTIVDKVVEDVIDGKRFIFVPYVPPGKLEDALNTISEPLNNTVGIFCHQEFYGAKMGAIKSQAGDKWPTTHPLTISGHVHDHDLLQPNLIYVGTPMQHAFGDREDKTVSIFTFNIELETGWNEDRVDLGLKKRIITYLTPEKIHTYEPPPDKLVKVVIKGDEAEIKAIAKLDKIKQLKKMGIKISYKITSDNKIPEKNGLILRLGYKDRLITEIQQDPKQVEWFNKLFK